MNEFKFFGFAHIGFLLFEVGLLLSLYFFRNKIKSNLKLVKIMRYSFAIMHLCFEFSYYGWAIYMKRDILTTFPLELCAIGLYLSVFFLLFNSEKIWRFSFPVTIIGAIIAILFGDADGYGLLSFRFFHFFMGHGLLIITNLFGAWILGFSMKFKEYRNTLIAFYLVIIFTYIVDKLVGANFMYLIQLPDSFKVLTDPFGAFYVIPMVILLSGLYFIPVFLLNLKIKKNKN